MILSLVYRSMEMCFSVRAQLVVLFIVAFFFEPSGTKPNMTSAYYTASIRVSLYLY